MAKPGTLASPQVATRRTEISTDRPDSTGGRGFWLAVVAIAWLALTLWSARAGLATDIDQDVALNEAAVRLPAIIQASLLAGAAVGYALASRFASRLARPLTRVATGLVAGLLIGGLASGAILLAHGMPARVAGFAALSVGLGGAVGGALGSITPAVLAAAALPATITVIGLDFLTYIIKPSLITVLGDAPTSAAYWSREGWFLGSTSLIVGVIGGVIAYLLLRRQTPGWPYFLLAGAAPGLLIAISELLTRTAGARLINLASATSSLDKTNQAVALGARLNHALVVLFVGGLLAMILHGRTLNKPR